MPQISKKLVSKEISERIIKIFLECFENLRNERETEYFLNDFLTPTEITMVAKRIAVAVMIAKGYQYETIKDVLKVSDYTIANMKLKMANMNEITKNKIRKIVKKDALKKFFLKVDSLLDIVPPKTSWKDWGKRKYKRKIDMQAPL